jgi:hypothetical protein
MVKFIVVNDKIKNTLLAESKHIREWELQAYPKKRGHKKTYRLDKSMMSLLDNIQPEQIEINASVHGGIAFYVDSEEEKEILIKQSEYLHDFWLHVWLQRKKDHVWVFLDSEDAGIVMHIYTWDEFIHVIKD